VEHQRMHEDISRLQLLLSWQQSLTDLVFATS
jgi:hypothetical protein